MTAFCLAQVLPFWDLGLKIIIGDSDHLQEHHLKTAAYWSQTIVGSAWVEKWFVSHLMPPIEDYIQPLPSYE